MQTSSLQPGLILVHGNRAESLRDLLVAWTRQYPLAPLESETILVQSNGIAQWLKLALAEDPDRGGCGIAAGLAFSLPSTFVWNVYRSVLGNDAVPEASPLDKSRLVWRLMRMIPALIQAPVFAPLARFLADAGDLRKRHQLAERIADLFDQYQVYRADWLAEWSAGRDHLIDAMGFSRPLPADALWQPTLWRQLRADVAAQFPQGVYLTGGRAGVHAAFLDKARHQTAADRPAALPRRVLVFGISSLPRQSLEVLEALARWSQVFVCVPNPCQHFWSDIVSGQDLLRAQQSRQARKQGSPASLSEATLHLHAHPLLAAWGKQGRDFIALLDERDEPTSRAQHQAMLEQIGQRIDLFEAPEPTSLLARIQADILALQSAQDIRERALVVDPADDPSLRFHVAHSPQREVEILHDQLLEAFQQDPTLRPRDIVVMVPDITAYAPHIEAVFGALPGDDPRHLPYAIADQRARQIDPLLDSLVTLLALPQARLGVSELLDLLEVPALHDRFLLAAEDLPTLHDWIRGANIRWGLDDAHRQALGLPAGSGRDPHTWRSGLQRMLLGYATGFDAPAWQEIEPYGEVGGLAGALLGKLIVLLERLETHWRALQSDADPATWVERLRTLLDDFYLAKTPKDAYTLLQLEASLQAWREACADARLEDRLPLSIVAEQWLQGVEGSGLNQRFFAGAVTFGTLMPMRAIPFRHICLLGMHDGNYPRSRKPVDFDLMGADYRPGDRSRREDDRYLFLEALLAARDRLYLSWVGRSINDNSERPPSVLVAQLRDHLRTGWRLPDGDGEALLDALTLAHPLQAFSPRYLTGQPPYFTYVHEWLPGQRNASARPLHALPPVDRDRPLSLRELADFLRDPVRAFLQQRLDIHFEDPDPTAEDAEPFELDGLQRWSLQDALLRDVVEAVEEGQDPAPAVLAHEARWFRRGDLPPGPFADPVLEALVEPVDAFAHDYHEGLQAYPERMPDRAFRFEIDIGGRRWRVEDTLTGLRIDPHQEAAGPACAWLGVETGSLIKDKHYLFDKIAQHWVRHLALHIAVGPTTSTIVSRAGTVALQPIDPASAQQWFGELVEAWQAGMTRPLPLAVRTAAVWLHACKHQSEPGEELRSTAHDKARQAYEPGYKSPGEVGHNPYLQRGYPDYAALCATGEFEQLALRLVRPMVEATHTRKEKREHP